MHVKWQPSSALCKLWANQGVAASANFRENWTLISAHLSSLLRKSATWDNPTIRHVRHVWQCLFYSIASRLKILKTTTKKMCNSVQNIIVSILYHCPTSLTCLPTISKHLGEGRRAWYHRNVQWCRVVSLNFHPCFQIQIFGGKMFSSWGDVISWADRWDDTIPQQHNFSLML